MMKNSTRPLECQYVKCEKFAFLLLVLLLLPERCKCAIQTSSCLSTIVDYQFPTMSTT